MMQPPTWFVLLLALTFVVEYKAARRHGPLRRMTRIGLGLLLAAVALSLVGRTDPSGPWAFMAPVLLLGGFLTLMIRSIRQLFRPPDDGSQDKTSIDA